MTKIRQNKKTTIYDLAELAGVSASAVSAILNGNWQKRRISAQLAEKVIRIAEEQNYAVNKQASLLRSNKSKIIGMLVPKYDNRYFGSIVEHFEEMARERGLFPIITCTRRDPELEIEAARAMISYQVDWLVSTGATNPDKITEICQASGVSTLNLDLPGLLAPSVISDNYLGAKNLTQRILSKNKSQTSTHEALIFIGGREHDHNTRERIRGFIDAHNEKGITVPQENILACGYAPEKAEKALSRFFEQNNEDPQKIVKCGLFINSTISLEGVIDWLGKKGYIGSRQPHLGCFDWDPFVALLGNDIEMVKQDVPTMLNHIFKLIDNENSKAQLIEVLPVGVVKE
ncbi:MULTISPECIES: LacI family DNA-binding transcriptional regulator [Providencia]|uniref:Degradation activator n=1 Tax=Providencia rettgeri TaxID=587 RepID=A0A1B8SR81_PRORE|nr:MULTISPECIES: LacI family DNA-binding transcriptional regulator [Providencia]EHZ7765837.1 LacI family DNA-binding transcriptional regulator [Providencia rettgeri]EIJ7168979.1 LacI family DNA-binding transcriptional regulator [Providencia rettgeri]EJD6045484.1 LacI family DNA-binding transcriptional regulator [Providencia rettgeri]EJD6049553.1 LacI family DNA-binding transcriptional regulator [Providencia rettgeri]EJF7713545.1 LacI family DNA-binding transcriptional regulator [Providencia re